MKIQLIVLEEITELIAVVKKAMVLLGTGVGGLGGLSTGALLSSRKYNPYGVLGGSIGGGLLSYYLAKKFTKKYKVGEEFKQKLDSYVENSLKNEPFAYKIDYDLNYDPHKKGSRPYTFSFNPVE